ncbi:hypothetical protein KEJ49_07930 [Candidatus Bathyarchaeota archaeon]|nr:hypothetical protein [Candidatus Bathyarchaeota archaeon]
MRGRSTKGIVMTGIMGAFGNALSFLSIRVAPLVPSLPLGPISVSIALDMSHIATFIAALFGGPIPGCLTGLIGGLLASYEFGFSKGNLITGFGLPIGKALTGLTAGIILRRFGSRSRNGVMMVPITVASYIPEGAYTALLFIYIFPIAFGLPRWIASILTLQILAKAFIEMAVMGLILMGLIRNRGFFEYIKGLFS